MPRNLGDVDRTFRLFLGAVLAIAFSAMSGGTNVRLTIGLVSVYLLASGILGWCVVYGLLRLKTTGPNDAVANR